MEQENMRQLLTKVAELSKYYDGVAKLKKENFNVFSVLHKDSEEERLHSAFIAELLNPQGSHEMGNKFLKLFLKQAGLEGFPTKGVRLTKEKHIPKGRMDIYLSNGIAIENKIYAKEGEGQLERYYKFLQEKHKDKHRLIYLTLYGEDSQQFQQENNEKYLPLSYRDDIRDWLEACQKEAVDYPTLRESIKQYLFLVKKLTGQSTQKEMEEEIQDLILSNIKEAKVIADNYQGAMQEYLKKTFEEVWKEANLGEGWKHTISPDLSTSWASFTIRHDSWSHVAIYMEGSSMITDKYVYGAIARKSKESLRGRVQILEKVQPLSLMKAGNKSLWWFCSKLQALDIQKVKLHFKHMIELCKLFEEDFKDKNLAIGDK